MTEPKKMIPRPLDTTEVGLDELRARLAKGSRTQAQQAALDQLDGDDLEDRIASGVAKALAITISDEQLIKAYWHQGWKEFVTHTQTGTSQWIGKRLLAALVMSMVVYGLVWLGRNGK